MDEAPVAEIEQVLRHLAHPVGDIEVDPGHRTRGRGIAVEHDQGQIGAVQGAQRVGGHGRGDHTVERGAGRGEGVPGRAGAVGRRVEDDAEAVFGGDRGGPGVHPGEELVGEGRDDEQSGPGTAQAQITGGEIRPVSEPAGGLPYPVRGGLGDPAAPLAAEDQGHGGLGDACGPCHVTTGRPGRGGLRWAGHSGLRAGRGRCRELDLRTGHMVRMNPQVIRKT